MIAWIGAITALFAATIAVAQNDIKRVLAYSTVSQLGYMFLAVGSGAYVVAIFHMITHAFFKALLFLGAGSVIHGMHDEQDMRRMGKLFIFMPVTAVTFIVGWLAIAGVPPFAGFWSKDETLLYALADSVPLYLIGLLGAIITAYYMTRQVIMVFFGKAHWKDRADEHGAHGEIKPHESPWIMLLPLVVLAILATVGGIVELPFTEDMKHLEHWLAPVTEFGEANIEGTWADDHVYLLMAIATVASLGGIALAWIVYQLRRLKPVEPKVLEEAYYYDRAGTVLMGGRGYEAAEAAAWFDANVVDGAVEGTAVAVRDAAGELRKSQTGFIRAYAALIGVGVVVLLAWFVVARGIL
jgi:NADH-quinone oxidoreductase subunit L